jgi:hypothetical protein
MISELIIANLLDPQLDSGSPLGFCPRANYLPWLGITQYAKYCGFLFSTCLEILTINHSAGS